MEIRYVGDQDVVDLAAPGGFVQCEKGKWLDLGAELEAIGVPARHAEIIAAGMVDSDTWEMRGAGTRRAARRNAPAKPRKAKAAASTDDESASADEPSVPAGDADDKE